MVLLNNEVLPLGAVRAEDLGSDYGLLTWDMWQVTESLTHGQNPYRTNLLYYPLGSNLAAHTLGPGFFPVGLASRAVLRGRSDYPVYAHRVAIVLCFSLGMFLAHVALRALGAGPLPALAAATGWAFAAFWGVIVANQTLVSACFLIPALTLAVLRVVRTPSATGAAGLAALTSATVYFSEYYAAFLILAVGVLAIVSCSLTAGRERLRTLAASIGLRGAAFAAAVGLVVALPFLSAWSDSSGRPPKERQVLAGGANLAGFFLPDPAVTPLYRGEMTSGLIAHVTRGRGPFLGAPTLLLAAFAAVTLRGARRLPLAFAAVFFLLSLGPYLKVLGTNTGIPLPYAALVHLPPFDMARNPQRLAVFGIWALICMAALGLTALAASATRRLGRLAGGVVVTLALGWWVAEGYRPGLRPVVVAPPVDLRHVPPGAVVNVPLSVMDGLAMFLQVFHGRPIVTGYVSRASKSQFDHVSRWQELLERDARLFAAELRRQGVGTVVLEPGTADDVAASLMGSGLRVVDVRGWVPAPGQATSGSTGTRAERGPDLRSPVRPSPAPTP